MSRNIHQAPRRAEEKEIRPSNPQKPLPDLEACPRCGEPVAEIRWGQTNCPRCGLHFECC